MLAYMTLAATKQHQNPSTQQTNTAKLSKPEHNNKQHNNADSTNKVTYTLIENFVSLFCKRRSHHNMVDFDGKYLKNTFMKKMVEERDVKFSKTGTELRLYIT